MERKSGTNSHLTALGWLRNAFSSEYAELLEQERARRNVGDKVEKPPFRDVHEQIKYAYECGQITAPRTPEVDRLLVADGATVRLAAADDAKDQEERNMVLRHPLMLGRWENALRELGEMTAERAHAETPHGLGTLPEDFYALPLEEATVVLNARRFLAAIQQRRLEYKRHVRQITHALRERERESSHAIAAAEAKAAVGQLLIERRSSEYAYVRAALRPHEERDGFLPRSLVTSPKRAEIKRRVLAALADGTWMQSASSKAEGAG
ncbi:hypothetical protein [Streptomyces sp. YIM S03343]